MSVLTGLSSSVKLDLKSGGGGDGDGGGGGGGGSSVVTVDNTCPC